MNAAALQNKPGTSRPKDAGKSDLLPQRKCDCGAPTSALTGKCEACSDKKRTGMQEKCRIGAPGDREEQQAENIAQQLMPPAPLPSLAQARRTLPQLQRRESGPAVAEQAPPIVHQVLSSPGRPLDEDTRAFFEPRLKQDFNDIRIHTDARAAQSAEAVNARAYTVGRDIVFADGAYAPETKEGKGILAHELTHTVQQGMTRPRLDRLGLDGPNHGGSSEREAEQVRAAIRSDREPDVIRHRIEPTVARLPGSPAGGCGVCYGTPKAVGIAAHVLIEAAFIARYPFLVNEFPLAPSPTDDNGKLDLAEFTGPEQIDIAEIKPSNVAGLLKGDSDLLWYEAQLEALGFTVGRLNLPPPIEAIPFPTLGSPPCPATHSLFVDPPVNGIYTYWCTPDFAQLIGQCPCTKPPPPPPVPVVEKEKEKVKEDDKDKEKDKVKDKIKEPPFVPVPPIPVPTARDITILLAALTAAAYIGSKLKGAAKGRITAYATAIAMIILLANGAEASVSLEGEDPLESLFKLAEANGQTIPDDIKEAIRKDPQLRETLTRAVQTGNFTEAQRQAGEQVARAITQHRDEFTEEELDILLKATEGAQTAIPGGEVSVAELKKAIEAKKKGVTATDQAGGSGGTGEGTAGTKEGDKEGVKPEGGPAVPPIQAKTPEERLVEGMASKGKEGPKLTPELREKLLVAARESSPPLTDKEVDELLTRVGSAAGMTEEELVDSVRKGVVALRTGKEGGEGDGAAKEDQAKKTEIGESASAASRAKVDKVDPGQAPDPKDKDDIAVFDTVIDQIGWITPGDAYLSLSDPSYETGKTYLLLYVGKDEDGVPFAGEVPVTINKKGSETWEATIAAGGVLYTKGRRYGITRSITDTLTPPKGATGKAPEKNGGKAP